LCIALCICTSIFADESPKVEIKPAAPAARPEVSPNATLRFEFPELSPTLSTLTSGDKAAPVLTIRLPENYTADGQFGLVLHLDGGGGGKGDNPGGARNIVGPRDYVCANLPLFKKAMDKRDSYGGLVISMDDFQTISAAYRVMLKKLFEMVPNIDPERSAMGGFSNGAHTTAVLLAGQDETVLEHFRIFYFVDGGVGPLAANCLQKFSMKRCRFLALAGDQPAAETFRQAFLQFFSGLSASARQFKLDFTAVTMRGYGHAFPAPYGKLIGCWIRKEPLPEIEPATRPAPATMPAPATKPAGAAAK